MPSRPTDPMPISPYAHMHFPAGDTMTPHLMGKADLHIHTSHGDGLDSIDICTGYKIGDRTVTEFPSDLNTCGPITPIYESWPGWTTPTKGALARVCGKPWRVRGAWLVRLFAPIAIKWRSIWIIAVST